MIVRVVHAFNAWIGSIQGVIFGLVTTLVSVPLVVFHVDRNGFDSLYYMTAVSYLTQFTLTLAAIQLHREGAKHERLVVQMLKNQADTMTFLIAAVKDQGELLEEIHDEVEHDLAVPDPGVPDDEREVG